MSGRTETSRVLHDAARRIGTSDRLCERSHLSLGLSAARSLYSVRESIDQPAFGRDCRAVDDIRRLSLVQTDSAMAKLDDFRLEFTLNGISQRCQSRKPTSPLAITGH